MAKLKLDLRDIYSRGHLIDFELERVIDEAVEKRSTTGGIIAGNALPPLTVASTRR